jgi:predicted DNA-binding transcriptional regulator YafY
MLDIIEAIESKLKIEFYYKSKHRVVEPYLLGLNVDGELILRAYQGGSNAGLKLWKVDEMRDIKISTQTFLFAKPLFKKSDKQFQKVLACVS